MRQRIEDLLTEEQAARRKRAAINRDEEPRAWALADSEWTDLRGQLSSAGREAVRSLGLSRELNRALGNTGFAIRNIGMDLEAMAIVIELEGEPETPAQRRRAADPAVGDTVRRVADEFHGRTGFEVQFPYDRLG